MAYPWIFCSSSHWEYYRKDRIGQIMMSGIIYHSWIMTPLCTSNQKIQKPYLLLLPFSPEVANIHRSRVTCPIYVVLPKKLLCDHGLGSRFEASCPALWECGVPVVPNMYKWIHSQIHMRIHVHGHARACIYNTCIDIHIIQHTNIVSILT